MKLLTCVVTLLGLWTVGSPVLRAEDLFVRANHTAGVRSGLDWNNAWNGFADIKWGEGVGRLGPGDTLWIAGGAYTSPLVVGASGTALGPIRLKRVRASDAGATAAAGWNSAFDAQVTITTGGACIYFYNGVGSYVEVDGRVKSGIRVNYANGGSGVELDGGANFTDVAFRYIEAAGPGPITQVADTRGFDLTIAGLLTNITVSHCEAHHSDTLIQVTQSRNLLIEYTDLHHAGAINAATYHPNTIYLGQATNATIRYNILREIDVEGLFFGDPGNDGVQIYGNLFYQGSSPRNSGRGIEFDNSANSSNVVVHNNTFVDLPLPGVNFNNGQSHPGAVVRNNIFWNCSANYGSAAHDHNFYSGSSNFGEANGIAGGSAPFVDAARYDYHLTGAVGAKLPKDKGAALGAPFGFDRDGNARGADGLWDIGAYEYPAGGTPPPANTAPTVSAIANQATLVGTAVGPIPFTVGDAETAAGALLVTASSNNPTLLPASGLVLGGSGASRTVTLTPAAGQTGSATVALAVSDGALATTTSFTLVVSGSTPPPPTGGGLVAAYSFDEGAGAVAADASGNANHGEVRNAVWASVGRFGGALSFNGSSSLVFVPSSSSLAPAAALTLQAWVRPAVAQTGWRTIVQKEVDAYFLHASGDGALRPAGGGTINGAVTYTSAPAAIAVGVWTHLALTYDGAALRLFVNGAQVASRAQTGPIQTNATALRIGGNAPYGEYFSGLIDEVRIYARALSAAEIQADMATAIGGPPPPPPPPANTAPQLTAIADQVVVTGNSAGPLAFSVADAETAAGNLVVSGSSSDAVLVPASALAFGGSGSSRTLTVTPTAGRTGAATITYSVSDGSLSAARSFRLTVEPPPNTPPTISPIGGVTLTTGQSSAPLAFTVGDAETPADQLVLSAATSDPVLLPLAGISFGGVGSARTVTVTPAAGRIGTATVAVTIGDGTLTATTQFTVTVKIDTTPSIAPLGDLVTAVGDPVGPLAVTLTDADTDPARLTLGVASDNAALLPAGAMVLGGSGKDRTLTLAPAAGQTGLAQVTLTVGDGASSATRRFLLVVNAPASRGLVAAYAFNEGSGLVARDLSGLGNHGELRGAQWTAAGKFGGALGFNGTNAFVYVPPAAALNPGARLTLAAWVLPTAAQSGWRTVLQKETDAYFLHASSNGSLRPAAGGTFGGKKAWVTHNGALAVGAWAHLAATYDGALVRLYVNGALVASKAQTGTVESNAKALRLGGNAPYGEYFRGSIDEVRIYNRALSAAEIQTDMARPVAGQADPNAWTRADLGLVGLAGTMTVDSAAGTFTAQGAGAGFGGSADAGCFVHRALDGDGTVEVRLDALAAVGAGSRAGVMLRASLAADAPAVLLMLDLAGGAALQARATAGAVLAGADVPGGPWLRLVRVGATVVAMTSADGQTWTAVGRLPVGFAARVFAGFAVASGDTTRPAGAVFAEPFIE